MKDSESQASAYLAAHVAGDPKAASQLLPLVYEELRAIAAREMIGEHAAHTLQATALVHEAYIRLVGAEQREWDGRTHFLAIAAQTLRRVLVDHARGENTLRRGGAFDRVAVEEASHLGPGSTDLDTLALEVALEKLERVSRRQSRIVELRFYSGLTIEETASILGVSSDTVKAEWRVAKAWLNHELTGASRNHAP